MDWKLSRTRDVESYGDMLPTWNLDYWSTIGYLGQGTTAPSLPIPDRRYLEPLPSRRAGGMHAMGGNPTESYIEPGRSSQQGLEPTSHVRPGHCDQHQHFIGYSQAPMSLPPSTEQKSLPKTLYDCPPPFDEQWRVRGRGNATGPLDVLVHQGTSPYCGLERSTLPYSGESFYHSGAFGDESPSLPEIAQQNGLPEEVPDWWQGQHRDSTSTSQKSSSISLFAFSDELRTASQKSSMNPCLSRADASVPCMQDSNASQEASRPATKGESLHQRRKGQSLRASAVVEGDSRTTLHLRCETGT
jgi:hypothetical protein